MKEDKIIIKFDGIIYIGRKAGGAGKVFAPTQREAFSRAKYQSFNHTRLASSTNVWNDSYRRQGDYQGNTDD